MNTFYANNNPNLTCIEVDNVAWANTNWTVIDNNIDPIASFSENCTTGITDNLNTLKLAIYPNPATTEINVSGYSPAYLKLCNAVGQTVAESKSNKLYIGNLSQGLYVLQLFDANGQQVKTEKVIVAK